MLNAQQIYAIIAIGSMFVAFGVVTLFCYVVFEVLPRRRWRKAHETTAFERQEARWDFLAAEARKIHGPGISNWH